MKITNEKLYKLCEKYGAAARFWRQKFIGLLPEVNRRRLFEKKGFSSIFEFAAKLCGLSADQVSLVLNLEKRFGNKPVLKRMLESGEASINKLSRVASIATPQNEEELAAKIRVLPISALNTLVKDERIARDSNGLPKPLFEAKSLYVQTSDASLNFKLEEDVQAELNELHAKGIDVNELLREMLKKRRAEIAEEKEKVAQAQSCGSASSRYIPVEIKKILHQEFGEKCSILTCHRRAKIIHHTQRFSLSQNHDPRFLAPLCKEHHAIAHSIDLNYQKAGYLNIGGL